MSHHTPEDPQERCAQTLDEFFTRNYNKFTGYCKLKWNGSGEDLCHVATETLLHKKQQGTFVHISDAKTWRWLTVTAGKSARKVIGFASKKRAEIEEERRAAEQNAGWGTAWDLGLEDRTVSLDELRDEYGWEPVDDKDPAPDIDARKKIMQILAGLSDERCKRVIAEVVTNDADPSVVCREIRLNYSTFRSKCRRALEKTLTKKSGQL